MACYDQHRGEKLKGIPKSREHCIAMSKAKRTEKGRDPYYGPGWYRIRRQVRERDNHTCQDCGKHQRRPGLDVHHIVPRAAFHGDFDRANHPDNLVALCKTCHARRDNLLGRSRGIDLATINAP